MEKVGIYAGSFNPWHQGHTDIVLKALKVFDRVVVAIGTNSDKAGIAREEHSLRLLWVLKSLYSNDDRIEVTEFDGFLKDIVKKHKATALIRGLRDGNDLAYERNQQYWNEDLGLDIPTVLFICDRKYGHISSSAIRNINKLKEGV